MYRAGQKITIVLSYSTSYSLKYLLKKLPLSVIRFNWVGLCKNHPETNFFFKWILMVKCGQINKYLCFLLIRIEVRKWSIIGLRCHHLPHIESSNGIDLSLKYPQTFTITHGFYVVFWFGSICVTNCVI